MEYKELFAPILGKEEELKKLDKDADKAILRLSRKYEKKELRQKVMQNLLQKGYRMNDVIEVIGRKKI